MGKSENGLDYGDYRHFKERPSQVFIDQVSDHIARTGQPETHPELFRGRLDKTEDFLQLRKIGIDTKRRPEGDLAPCPRCHSPNKFKDGWLIYLPERGAVAVVGNECATGEAQAAAQREWEAREQRVRDEDYLISAVPQLPNWLAEVKRLGTVAEPTADFARRFRIEGKEHFERLKAARANGGQLSVTQVLERNAVGPRGIRSAGSDFDTVEHHVGSLQGATIINPRFDPVRDLREVAAAIEPHVQQDEEAAFHYVADMTEEKRNSLAASLKNAARKGKAVATALVDCRLFFSADNIRTMAEWGQHPYQERLVTIQFLMADAEGYRRFEVRKPYFQHRLPPEFWTDIGSVRFDA